MDETIKEEEGFFIHSSPYTFDESEDSDSSLSSSVSTSSTASTKAFPLNFLDNYNLCQQKTDDISNFVFYLGILAVASILWRFMWLFYFIKIVLEVLQSGEMGNQGESLKFLKEYSSPLAHYFINRFLFKDNLNHAPFKYFSSSVSFTQYQLPDDTSFEKANRLLETRVIKEIYNGANYGPSPTTLILQAIFISSMFILSWFTCFMKANQLKNTIISRNSRKSFIYKQLKNFNLETKKGSMSCCTHYKDLIDNKKKSW